MKISSGGSWGSSSTCTLSAAQTEAGKMAGDVHSLQESDVNVIVMHAKCCGRPMTVAWTRAPNHAYVCLFVCFNLRKQAIKCQWCVHAAAAAVIFPPGGNDDQFPPRSSKQAPQLTSPPPPATRRGKDSVFDPRREEEASVKREEVSACRWKDGFVSFWSQEQVSGSSCHEKQLLTRRLRDRLLICRRKKLISLMCRCLCSTESPVFSLLLPSVGSLHTQTNSVNSSTAAHVSLPCARVCACARVCYWSEVTRPSRVRSLSLQRLRTSCLDLRCSGREITPQTRTGGVMVVRGVRVLPDYNVWHQTINIICSISLLPSDL